MRRILAVRQDNNGDVTLLGPALRALAPRAEVILACSPSGEGAARLLPGVAQVVVVRAEWIAAEPRPIEPARIADDVALFRSLHADEAFVFTSFHQSALPTALLLRLAGVDEIAAISVDYPGSLVDTRVRVSDDIHEVERSLALVAARGYRLPHGDDGRLRYAPLPRRPAGLPERYVAVQPGATVPARRWDPDKTASLVARLRAHELDVVVVGSHEERALAARVCGTSGAIDTTGRTTFAEFAAIVRDACVLVVGNSSGIHVASAVSTPVVSIFPPTIAPVRFAPWRNAGVVFGDHDIACAGCRCRVCPIPHQPCIGDVDEADVVDAVLSFEREARTRGERTGTECIA